MYYFCTYFDHKFLPRGLALHESLTDHCPSFRLWVLCLDPLAHDALCQLNLPNLCPIALKDFENEDEELLSAKRNRSRIEYYFTCTPSLPLYVFNHNPEVDLITYLDADLYFFGDPKPIFEEMTNKSVAITEHRFPDHRREIMEVYGLYNVGWLSFRRDGTALDCLHWWRERCLEWCHDHPAEGRFADQKYLDEWPSRFQRVVVIRQKGVNVAPWNMANYQFRQVNDSILIDDDPLLLFHFHGLKQVVRTVYDPSFAMYQVRPSRTVVQRIYGPYLQSLSKAMLTVERFMPDNAIRTQTRYEMQISSSPKVSWLSFIGRQAKTIFGLFRGLLLRQYIWVINGRTF
jgi:hypothetical protein